MCCGDRLNSQPKAAGHQTTLLTKMSLTDEQNTLATRVLIRGLDDWVMACEVVSEIVESGIDKDDPSVSQSSIEILEHLILNGLVEAGDVSDDGFVPWAADPLVAVSLIKAGWMKLGRLPDLGDICWLRNTALGDEVGRNKAHH